MSSYKAIIFDLDGTAIPNKPNGMPSQTLITQIEEAKDTLILSAATGRPITNAKPILAALRLKHPCVISAGTQIIDPKTYEILWEANIEPDAVQEILNICAPYHYEVLIKNELMGEGRAAAERKINEHVNVMYVMGCAEADASMILAALENIPTVTAAGVISWTNEGVDIHITNKEATKEHAVSELLRLLKLKKDEVIGVGDADNDVHLFEAVGYKVAMGNATARLKSLADEITESVYDDGLANIIRKYI